jgi:hypothetical protein
MNTSDALKLMVKSFHGGIDVIALRVGKNPETLRKELSGVDPKFKLGEATAQLINDLCIEEQSPHCYAYVNAVAAPVGGFIKLAMQPAGASVAPSLIGSTVDLVTGASQVLADVTAARADGDISDNERRQIERDVNAVISSMQSILRAVERDNEAGKPGNNPQQAQAPQ